MGCATSIHMSKNSRFVLERGTSFKLVEKEQDDFTYMRMLIPEMEYKATLYIHFKEKIIPVLLKNGNLPFRMIVGTNKNICSLTFCKSALANFDAIHQNWKKVKIFSDRKTILVNEIPVRIMLSISPSSKENVSPVTALNYSTNTTVFVIPDYYFDEIFEHAVNMLAHSSDESYLMNGKGYDTEISKYAYAYNQYAYGIIFDHQTLLNLTCQ